MSREEDLERELRADLDLEAAEQQENGLTPEQARYAARRAFGNMTHVKEEARRMWGWNTWEIFMQEFRYGLRTLRKSPGYFEATRQRLVGGRFFEERDRNLNSVVLSEGEAKALWGSENPIGSQVRLLGRTFTVIGIVADSRSTSLKTAPVRMAYVYYNYRPPYTSYFLVRGAQSADALVSSVRQAIWSYAPDATVARVKTLDAQLKDSLAPERFQTLVLMAFGIAALLLAMLGIYGVLSYSVAARKQEIGVRMALGATRSKVYALTFAEAGAPVFAGLAAGVFASLMAGRVIRKLLYGIQVVDPVVILMVAGLFLASAAAAAFVPARRAASVDPMDALRSE